MAKVTITIEDMPNGRVKLEMTPKFSELAAQVANRNIQLTAAEGYGLAAINRVREVSNDMKTRGFIARIPKIGPL